jgi:hypothetical protein
MMALLLAALTLVFIAADELVARPIRMRRQREKALRDAVYRRQVRGARRAQWRRWRQRTARVVRFRLGYFRSAGPSFPNR